MSTIDTQDLRRALARHRPDPETFRRGVERKLAARAGAARDREPPPEEARAGVWRRAAALLPLDLLAGGPTGAALGKGGAGLGALALPAVSVAMLALAFLAGLRAALATRPAAGPSAAPEKPMRAAHAAGRGSPQERDRLVRAWWRAHRTPAAGVLLALAALGLAWPLEAVVGVLLVSIAAVALQVAHLARAGAATRARVGAFSSAFLSGLLGLALVPELLLGPRLDVGARLAGEGFPAYGAFGVVLWGSVACDLVGRWTPGWSRARSLAAALVPTALLVAFLAAVEGRALPAGPARLERLIARSAPPLDDAVAWLRLARVGAALEARGRAATPAAARRAVEATWSGRPQAAPLFDQAFVEQALAGAGRLDALPPGLWAAVAADPASRALAAGEAALVSPEHADLRVRALAREGLDEAERERLAAALRAAWPEPSAPRALEEMAAAVALARLIDRPLGPGLEREVHAALRLHWTDAARDDAARNTERARGPAAFASTTGTTLGELGYPQYLRPTAAALELIRVHGAPAELDLQRVRRFLVGAATPSLVEVLAPPWVPLLTIQPARHEAAAALLSLEALLPGGPPARTWIGERVLLGAVLLVALCLLATLVAGQSASEA